MGNVDVGRRIDWGRHCELVNVRCGEVRGIEAVATCIADSGHPA